MLETLGNVVELLIYAAVFIALLALVDRFWAILYFVGGLYVAAVDRREQRRARRTDSVGSGYRVRRLS